MLFTAHFFSRVTMEYREGLAKNAKTLFNQTKDSLREIQNKHKRQANKTTNQSEDLVRNVLDTVRFNLMYKKDLTQ